VLAALAGWFIARRAVSGIEAVTRTARQIADGALEKRVPSLPGQDEINRLATAFNEMIDRIQALVSGIREMNDHIAHDLKSPVTRIRGLAEVTLTTDRSLSGFETMAASTVEECDRLLDMINTMLVISETEAGVQRLQPEALDMAAVVREACELFEPFAEDKNVGLSCIAPDRAVIQGEIGKIQRMVSNLIDNAVKYTPSGGSVALILAEETDHVRLEVSDTGIGISETDLPHVFERFYRCDRSRSEPGSGLGLSLVKAIVLFHGGEIAVDSAPGRGTHIRILLPKNPTRKTALNRNTFDKNPNPR
jgi:signal transduction histidine kinase